MSIVLEIVLHVSSLFLSYEIIQYDNHQFYKSLQLSHQRFLDHPVHPPIDVTGPWDVEFPPDLEYVCRPRAGVYNVYSDEKDVENDKPINYHYPDLNTFISDMNVLCNMIADGPL